MTSPIACVRSDGRHSLWFEIQAGRCSPGSYGRCRSFPQHRLVVGKIDWNQLKGVSFVALLKVFP